MMYHEDTRLESSKKSLKNVPDISQQNKQIIFTFLDEITAKGLSVSRVLKYSYYLTRIVKIHNKDLSDATKADIVHILNEIERAKVRGGPRIGKPISDWGKHDFRVVVKRFYKWLREREGQHYSLREYPTEVSWFSLSFPAKKRRKPRNLLVSEDVEKIMNAATNTRNKLFVRLLFETGARIGELLSLTLDGINWDEYGATIQIYGKTGERKIRIIDSVPLLSGWMREHPQRENKQALLFCGINNKTVSYDYFRILLHELGKKTGINKPMNPHHWRHSRATQLSKFLTEAQLCMFMGWVPGSSQPGTYVHLSGRDLDSAILKMKGIKIDKENVEEKKPIPCPRCHVVNDSLAKFCIDCGLMLDEKSILEFEQRKDQATKMGFTDMDMLKDPEFRQFYNEMLAKTWENFKKMKDKSTN
ncbi:MAG: tyrosine-type recombinase/integrase [Candidatus Thermoplasmatota archaeon]|nr:tyrosine-type recombinase/integrase [Candidatus Thermoplasmatota archaeon]MBU1941159.1 tyrosine-type recombinase/integrase [Candidatus Thermoplasmatota archaeon]